MARTTPQRNPKSPVQSQGGEAVRRLHQVPLTFELYGDTTVRAGADGLGIRLQLGPYQLLFDCGAATAQALAASTDDREQPSEQPLAGEADAIDGLSNGISKNGAGLSPNRLGAAVDFVFCSHAHGDHAQGLLALHRAWPGLPIFASDATSHLLSLNWPGVVDVPDFCQGLSWGETQVLTDDLSVTLFPAGHLPGSAVIVVTFSPQPRAPGEASVKPIHVAYLGDAALSPSRCTPGLDLDALRGLKPELLIAEGSYGTDRYPRRRQQESDFVEQLLAVLAQGRLVLMPVPTLGIAQEVIVLLRSHHLCTGQAFDIWVDEPIAQGCDRYLDLLDEMPVATQNFARNQSLFWDDRVRPYVRRLAAPSLDSLADVAVRPGLFFVHFESDWSQFVGSAGIAWELWLDRTDKLSSTASGWATHRAFTHQSPLSLQVLASRLQTGELHLNSYQLTDHCDGLGTTQLIHNLRPQHVLLVHGGSLDALQQLSHLEELRSRYSVHVPEPGVEVSITVNESFLQSPSPEPRYGGELQEDLDGIRFQLADEIAQDPRWQALAETGLLEIEWQGDGLLIRGVSPQKLMSQGRSTGSQNRRPTDCCKTCCFYRNQYCRNPESPLESVRVLAESYCQEFQRLGMSPG